MAPLIQTATLTSREKQVTRLILQSLHSMGYEKAASELALESGLDLESQTMTLTRQYVLGGEWLRLNELVPQLDLSEQSQREFKFTLRKQQYLELLEDNKVQDALRVLQDELATLDIYTDELHRLSRLMMFSNPAQIQSKAQWDGRFGQSRNNLLAKLSTYLSPSICIQENRLNTLLDQALLFQQQNCVYHNQTLPTCLLVNHECQREDFPNYTTHLLQEHRDEVWYMQFSHDGNYLASASRDARAIIWDIKNAKVTFVLSDHKKAISYLAWSPDDSLLLTGSNDFSLKIWDTKTGDLVHTFLKHTESITSCAWHPDGHSFISGSVEKSMYMWSLNGEILHHWPGLRIVDLAITKDGKTLIFVQEKNIRFIDLVTFAESEALVENDMITSICLSDDDKYLLVSLSTPEIHLWDLGEKKIHKKYFGQKQGRFVIRCCFGGINQNFILSGSECGVHSNLDNRVYVWHRELGTVIECLPGHSACVNGIAWNSTLSIFASASDDHTIRIWGPSPQGLNREYSAWKEKME